MIETLLLLLLLIFCSGFFSGSETALTGASRARIYALANHGNARAKTVGRLHAKMSRVISTILLGNTFVNNAAAAIAGTHPYPARQTGVRVVGNVDCADVPCFVDPERWDFSPSAGSRLKGAGVSVKEAWMPREDFFAVRRGRPLSAGAIERPSGPLALAP